eukprot:308674-Pyramimonas_sp.AAC.1
MVRPRLACARAGGGFTRAGGGFTQAEGGFTRAGGGFTRAGGVFTQGSPDGMPNEVRVCVCDTFASIGKIAL